MRRTVWAILTILATAAGLLAVVTMGTRAMSKEPRFPELTMDQLTDQQKALGEQIMKVSSVGLGGPYNPLLRSPVMGQRMFDLLYYLRWNTSVPLRLNEMAARDKRILRELVSADPDEPLVQIRRPPILNRASSMCCARGMSGSKSERY